MSDEERADDATAKMRKLLTDLFKDCRTATEEHCARVAYALCANANQHDLGKTISNALWSGK